MDGFGLARRIRAIGGAITTKLVAVTGYGQKHDRRRTRAAGLDAHLVKPVDIQEVSELIAQLANDLEKDQARDARASQ